MGIGDAARWGGFWQVGLRLYVASDLGPRTSDLRPPTSGLAFVLGGVVLACGFWLQIFFLGFDWDDGFSARRAALIWESGYTPPPPPPSESLAGRGVRKKGAQNLDVKELRGQNLENKGLMPRTASARFTAPP